MKMEVKTEEKLELAAYISVCNMCLSTDRRTCGVESVSYAYGLMTDWAPQDGARVCWECRALLARVLRFKVQALRAKEFLEAANVSVIGTDILSGKCMSQLRIKSDLSFYIGSPLARSDTPDVKVKPVDHDSECEAWEEDDVKPSVEIEVPRLEVKAEETALKKRKRRTRKVKRIKSEMKRTKSEVNRAKSEVKRPKSEVNRAKSEVKRPKSEVNRAKSEAKRPKSEVKRTKLEARRGKSILKDDIMDVFAVSEAELVLYKESAFPSVERSSNFQCKMCTEGFKYEINWRKHNQEFHSEEAGTFVCEICTSRFKSQELLTQHRSKHFQLFRCRYPSCSYVQHKRRSIQQHYAKHLVKQQSDERERGLRADVFECAECGKVCTQRKQLVFHIKSHTKRVMCELCSYKCSNVSQLRIHTLAHLGPSHRPYECERCHKRFITKSKLLYHTRSHTGERPFQCETCGRGFVCKEALTRHVKEKHFEGDSKVRNLTQPRTKSFFMNRRGAQNSAERKDKVCEHCNKTFKFYSQLQYHVRYVHNKEKDHHCTICAAKFSTKNILEVHMRTHSDERPFKCDQCTSTFKYKSGLKGHKLIHKGEKPHQCSICGSRFTLKENLVGHMKTHTNERPFECSVCGKTFAWKRNLKNHFKTHVK